MMGKYRVYSAIEMVGELRISMRGEGRSLEDICNEAAAWNYINPELLLGIVRQIEGCEDGGGRNREDKQSPMRLPSEVARSSLPSVRSEAGLPSTRGTEYPTKLPIASRRVEKTDQKREHPEH